MLEEATLRSWFLGVRIQRRRSRHDLPDPAPIVEQLHEGRLGFIFRFGVLVTYGLAEEEERRYREALASVVVDPFDEPESEELHIRRGTGPSRVDEVGNLYIEEITADRLEVVANVLAKSVVLAHFEHQVAPVIERVESLATDLRRGGSLVRPRALLNEIGTVMLVRSSTVGRAEISEKPEIVWEDSELDRLYEQLSHEFELRDRDLALGRKLELISDTTGTYLDLLQTRKSLRLEWYIVTLILIEVVLIVYDMFVL